MKNKIIVLDTETTGLNPAVDEILQLSIINNKRNGAVICTVSLFYTFNIVWCCLVYKIVKPV